MRTVAETSLHLLCAQGPRQSDMLDSISKFRKGNWEKLWHTAIKNFIKMAAKEEEKPDQTEGKNQQAERQICSEMCLGGEFFKGEQDHLSRDVAGLWR